jgi:hypothetical protein
MELKWFEILVRCILAELKDNLGCTALLSLTLLLLILLVARFSTTMVIGRAVA